MNSTSHVAVIGAGIAGLSCATALQKGGVTVSLFEKSRGPAGRMSTRRGDGWQCDHGAQYFTARHADFRAEVARWQAAGVAALWTPKLCVYDGVSCIDAGNTVERFVGTPRMTAPAHFLADALTISNAATIKQLHRDHDQWQLLSTEHGLIDAHFDAVLLAVPAPQVVPLLRLPAPPLAALAASAHMRGCWALMLRFAAPVALPFDAAFVNFGPLRWIARDNAKPGRNGAETWLLHASAEWSTAHLEDDADSVAAVLLDAFRELGGPAPQYCTAHRWRYADTKPALENVCVWRADEGVGVCGDWLNGGKVEGAWRSGRALAAQVLQSIAAL